MFDFLKKKNVYKGVRGDIRSWLIPDEAHHTIQAQEVARRLGEVVDVTSIPVGQGGAAGKWPQVVIGAGEQTARHIIERANFVHKKTGNMPLKVILLDPRDKHDEFDLIALPGYEPHPEGDNIISTIGIINAVTPEALGEAEKHYKKGEYPDLKEAKLKSPLYAVLLGGRHVMGNFTQSDASNLAILLNEMVAKTGGSLMITNSPRTEKESADVLLAGLDCPHYYYDCKRGHNVANPYMAMLALADGIIVMGDSLRMCSEACSSGKEVRIFVPEDGAIHYSSLHEDLVEKGFARFFEGECEKNSEFNILDESGRIASKIKELLVVGENK